MNPNNDEDWVWLTQEDHDKGKDQASSDDDKNTCSVIFKNWIYSSSGWHAASSQLY